MALPDMMGGSVGLIKTAANIIITHRDEIHVGDLVGPSTSSNCAVNSLANNASFTAVPIGRVDSIEKGSEVCTVEWLNVRAIATHRYSTVGTRGSNVIGANDHSTITGSATFGAQDNTYIWGIDTGNQTMTFLLL